MKIAFLNREASCYPGGDILSIVDLTEVLKEFDVYATTLQGQWNPLELRKFDLAMAYHVNFSWCHINFDGLRQAGIPYCVRPMFYPRPDLGMDYDDIRGALEGAAAVIPQSWREWDEIQQACALPTGGDGSHHAKRTLEVRRVEAVPNGTNERFHAANANGGSSRWGVLCVAARAGDKNMRLVETACMRLGIPFKMATSLPHHLMPLVYRQFRVFVSASDSERMSRTVGEALCAGCRTLAPVGNRGNEWFSDKLRIIDPSDEAGLQEAIEYAYNAPSWDYTPNERARSLTWRKTAQRMSEIYREVLSNVATS